MKGTDEFESAPPAIFCTTLLTYINVYRHSSLHPGPMDYHWWESAVWRRSGTISRGAHMVREPTRSCTRSCWTGDCGGPELNDHSKAICYEGTRWAGISSAFLIQSIIPANWWSIIIICVKTAHSRLHSLSVFCVFPVKFRWRRISCVENRPGSSHPAGVHSGISEHGLLLVCLARRQDSLSASERGFCLK